MEAGIVMKTEPQEDDTYEVLDGDSLPTRQVKMEMEPEVNVHDESCDRHSSEVQDDGKERATTGSLSGFDERQKDSADKTSGTITDSTPESTTLKGAVELPFPCSACGARFQRRRELDRHQVVHTGERKFMCPICGMRFRWKTNVQRHLLVHTAVKTFKCPLCDKSFRTNGNLKEHLAIHSEEKTLKCPMCDKLFGVKSNLTRHLRVHSGERNYKCSACDKRFRTKGNLKGHLLRHSGVKSFVCLTCNKTFYTNSHLKLHLRVHRRKGDPDSESYTTEGDDTEPLNLACNEYEFDMSPQVRSNHPFRYRYSSGSKPLNLVRSKSIAEGDDLSDYLEVVMDSKPQNLSLSRR